MKTRKQSALCALGLAAMILGGAASVSAQDTTATGRARSQQRIQVRKDQGTTPAATVARTDTVTITRTDTIRMTIRDTVTVTRTDTVTRIEELPLQPLPGFFFGVGVGAALPTGDFRGVAKDGFTGGAHLGFFPGTSPIGIRLDGAYTMFGARETDCPNCESTKLISGTANVLLRFPMDRKSRVNPVVYFLGGYGIDRFTDFKPYRTNERPPQIVTGGSETVLNYPGLPRTAAQVGDKSNFYHYAAGGGIQFSRFFLEAKYNSINTEAVRTAYVPITIGLNF